MEYIKLGTICSKIGSGSTPKGGASVYIDEGTSLIRSQNVYNLNFQYNGLAYITEEAAYKLRGVTIKKNDVLINITGDSVARTCIVPDDVIPARVNQHVAIIRPDENVINPYYLNYYLASPFMQATMLNFAVGKGASRNAMTKEMIEKFLIPCPTISIQSKIVDILKSYDKLIENNNKRIRLLEQMVESLYKEWFVRFRFPGYEDVEFENGVPKGWEWQMLVDVTKLLQRGISPIYDDAGIYTVISQKCIRGKTMDISEAKKQIKDYKEMLNLQDEDTVICSTGTGTLGRVGKVIGEYPNTTFDSHVTLARAKNGIGKQFLYGSIKNLQPRFMNMGIGSTNQQELYISLIRKTKILMPTDDLQQKFEDIVKPLHDEIGLIIKKNKYLIRQRDMLLPRLMSGKLEV